MKTAYLKQCLTGQEQLGKVFWLFYIVGTIGITYVGWMIFGLIAILMDMEFIILIFFFLVALPYFIWATCSVWNCAFNVGWKPWGYIARVVVVVFFVGYASQVVELISKVEF